MMYNNLEDTYIKVSAIYKKIRDAGIADVPIYISGAVAFGKTAAVEYFYRRKAHLRISGEAGCLEQMPVQSQIKEAVIVFDDISWIEEKESREYIIDVIKNRHRYQQQVILIGRSRLPGWLQVTASEEQIRFAGEKDLMLNREEVARFFESRNITASEEEISQIFADSYGHALTLSFITYHLSEMAQEVGEQNTQIRKGTCGYSPSIIEQVRLDLFHYYDEAFYQKWDREMRETLLAMCQYETFTIKMTEMVTGNSHVPLLFEKALSCGTFLTKLDEETYSYRKQLRVYFKWKQALICTKEQIEVNFQRAALYYTIEDNVEMALKCYKAAGDEEHISELLIKNAMKHPGTGHFFETREYYFSLPEEKIKESSILMSGMSMLYSIMFQPEKSEYWYEQLKEYSKKVSYKELERKEASVRLAYLNIALPHRGIHGIIQVLKDTAILCLSKKVKLPEFSVTSNLPSIMNGGLDFCEWSRNDKELGIIMKKPVEIVLGGYGVGLVDIALAESGMEKESMESYEIMTRLNNGYLMSDTSGKIEMCFAATGLMIKEHLVKGQPEIAENLYATFYRKVIAEKADYLLPNMRTFHMWTQLLRGNLEEAKEWLADAPDDMYAFCILDRYHHINKVRVLIALGRCEEALALVERLNLYFVRYDRNYLWIEGQILKSIALYRSKIKTWRETLIAVLKKAEKYHFIRVFAMEGNALKPLLDRITKKEMNGDYINQIKKETDSIALYHPDYMKEEKILADQLTDTEKRILKLMCSGASSKEICEFCDVSYSTYKFHTHNIYRKLDVNNRAACEREAKRLEGIQ